MLAKYQLTCQAWPRYLKIRRNMTTTAWAENSYLAITTNNILVSTDDEGKAVSLEEIKIVFTSIMEMNLKCTST